MQTRFLVLSLVVFSVLAWAAPTPTRSVEVVGTIKQLTHGPVGEVDGIILQDNTLIKFKPEALLDHSLVRPGVAIVASGDQILETPNKVIDHANLKVNNQLAIDDSVSERASDVVGVGPNISQDFKGMNDKSSIVAVSARPDGKIDRLFLADGTTVQLPREGTVDPQKVKLGDPVSVTGSGVSFRDGKFIQAMNVEGAENTSWIKTQVGNWVVKSGTVKQVLLTPQGDMDGILLEDRSAIRFAPVHLDLAVQFTPGTSVQAAGPLERNQILASSVILSRNNTVANFDAERATDLREAGIAGSGAPAPFPAPVAPVMAQMKDSAQIDTVFKNPQGKPESFVLMDGTNVRVPPEVGATLPSDLQPGDTVAVTGRGGRYTAGSAIEANEVQITNRRV